MVAAARPFGEVIRERLREEAKTIRDTSFSYHTKSQVGQIRRLLERHLNNTADDYFFLPKSGHPSLPEDLLVFLRLAIFLGAEHYDVLLESKVAELADVFRAKLGWLKGNIYSRVATPDVNEEMDDAGAFKSRFYETYIPKDRTVVLSGIQANLLRKKIREKRTMLGHVPDASEIKQLIADDSGRFSDCRAKHCRCAERNQSD